MSFLARLFLGVGGLVALLVVAQWWWVRGLTRELYDEVDEVVVTVGHSVANHFVLAGFPEPCPEGAECQTDVVLSPSAVDDDDDDDEAVVAQRKVKVITRTTTGASEGPAAAGGEPRFEVLRHHVGPDHELIELKVEEATTGGEEGTQVRQWKWLGKPDDHDRVLRVKGPDHEESIPIPSAGLRSRLEDFQKRLLWGSAGLLALGLGLAAVVAHRVAAPLRDLSRVARDVGEGRLGTQVGSAASGEVGEAIGAFNRMSRELRDLDAKNQELRAQRHLGEIGEIARGLAHTLRNPLNALGLSVEELASRTPGDGGGDGDALAAGARRQIRRIDRSIRSFLVLASQGGGAASAVDLGELAQDVALEALQDGRGKGVRLDVDVPAEPARLEAVEPELRAVLQALLVNAVEASPEGGTVAIRLAAPEPERVRVEIDDQGPGLAPEVKERLFTPHLTTKPNGSGMGLFLAHRVATTRYGGRLELGERPEGGTRAVLEIGPRREEPGDG